MSGQQTILQHPTTMDKIERWVISSEISFSMLRGCCKINGSILDDVYIVQIVIVEIFSSSFIRQIHRSIVKFHWINRFIDQYFWFTSSLKNESENDLFYSNFNQSFTKIFIIVEIFLPSFLPSLGSVSLNGSRFLIHSILERCISKLLFDLF